jgi:hypothetical protein
MFPYSAATRLAFIGDEAAKGTKVNTHLYLVQRSRMVDLYLFMVWCLIKHGDNFTFLPYPCSQVLYTFSLLDCTTITR